MNQQVNYHRQLFSLAIPMILSNITVPLLGLVDTAVLGHLSHSYYLAGSTVGAMLITFLTWMCGFLRMSSTGLAAQAYGAQAVQDNYYVLMRGLFVALAIGVFFILVRSGYLDFGLWLSGGSEEVKYYAEQYSQIRIWGLPAALANLVILGWLLGNQQAKVVMLLLIVTNLVNLTLDLYFVLQLNMGVEGVAAATLIAEYIGLIAGLYCIFRQKIWQKILFCEGIIATSLLFSWQKLSQFFRLNRDIFIRTLCLELCFLFITFQGARLGDEVVAANAILLNFLLLISFGLDGIANGAEALVGQAKGANDGIKLRSIVKVSLIWTGIFALIYSVFFFCFDTWLISLMTSIPAVITFTQQYIVWLWLMPVVACWCYLFDGVYIGLMQAKIMRNSMVIATFIGFFPVWYVFKNYGNHAIWFAFTFFMVLRGVTLAWHFYRRENIT